MRAQNLQELVYKQGSAGITKATVSIVFHNNDPQNGPSGYEDKEYITVTRQVRGHAVDANVQQAAGHDCQPQHVQQALLLVTNTKLTQPSGLQIVIGGRDKYTINGHAAQQGWVPAEQQWCTSGR